MIVYFKEKSKMLRTMLFVGMGICILYMFWLWTNLLTADVQTIQIIHLKELKRPQIETENSKIPQIKETNGKAEYLFVASSKGKYFYPKDCSKARALSVKNMLYFKDKTTAQAQGYIEYSGC